LLVLAGDCIDGRCPDWYPLQIRIKISNSAFLRRAIPMEKTMLTEVLVIGAGPTGLVLALWLTRLGVKVRIIDKTAEPGTTSRALAVQTRTLEFYRQIDLATTVVEHGVSLVVANFWVRANRVARARFGDGGVGLSPFPYALIFP